MKNLLIVMSGPSGVGKTTLRDGLLEKAANMVVSISCTTRQPRGREVNGRDYYFISQPDFDAKAKRGELLEHAVVHGNSYGTPREMVEKALLAGKDILLVIDVQGAEQVRARMLKEPQGSILKRGFVDIFIEPPSMEVLERRLTGRGEDAADVVQRRLANAREEMACSPRFKYRVVNDRLDAAVEQVGRILESERTHSR